MSRRKKWETRGKKKTRRSREDHEPMTKNATPFWERFGSVKNGHSIPLFFLEVRILICDMTHISGRKVSTFFIISIFVAGFYIDTLLVLYMLTIYLSSFGLAKRSLLYHRITHTLSLLQSHFLDIWRPPFYCC